MLQKQLLQVHLQIKNHYYYAVTSGKLFHKNEHAVVPLCSVSYLDENHAMKCGMQTAADCDLDVDEVQIIADNLRLVTCSTGIGFSWKSLFYNDV